MNARFFRQLTPRRKGALVLAVVWAVVFLFFLGPAAMRSSPVSWTPVAVLFGIFFGSFASAVVSVELLRGVVPSWQYISDEKHFNWVMVLFVVLLALAAVGYRFVYGASESNAF
ncbi:MAG: hypothetical protein NUV51_06380 [Sulfuricaulis sp.]|nr:hypothetical protein [Sulfuricaulis sp.]